MEIEVDAGSYSQRFAKAKNAETLIKELVRLGCPWRLSVPEEGKLKVSYRITAKAARQMTAEMSQRRRKK